MLSKISTYTQAQTNIHTCTHTHTHTSKGRWQFERIFVRMTGHTVRNFAKKLYRPKSSCIQRTHHTIIHTYQHSKHTPKHTLPLTHINIEIVSN